MTQRRSPRRTPTGRPQKSTLRRTALVAVVALVPMVMALDTGQAARGGLLQALKNAQQQMMAAANKAPNPNCTLIVPDNPLSAQGLATPFQLVATDAAAGPCDEANPMQSAFVQATLIDPANGQVFIYNPVVVNKGDAPAIAPTTPVLPARAVVGLWMGFQGTVLTLQGASANSLQQGACINGAAGSPFGQFAYCNAPTFFSIANSAIAMGMLAVPPTGTANDGQPCMTTRAFSLIDQDQSDNLSTTYLVTANAKIAQDTAANRNALGMGNAKVATNASDNRLLSALVDPALGCSTWKAPDLADNNTPAASLALDEMQAAQYQLAPSALIPPNDPMAQTNGAVDLNKINLFRTGVDQPPLAAVTTQAKDYCTNFRSAVTTRLPMDMAQLSAVASPDAAAASNLFTFMANRANASWTILTCQQLTGMAAPFALTLTGAVVTAAVAVPAPAAAPAAAAAAPVAPAAAAPAAAAPAAAVAPQVAQGAAINP